MKQAILNNWNFSRALRLIIGVVILMQAISTKDITIGILALLFIMMPVLNIGCCGSGACTYSIKKNNDNDSQKETTYEEVVK
jgi:hypothetical protein